MFSRAVLVAAALLPQVLAAPAPEPIPQPTAGQGAINVGLRAPGPTPAPVRPHERGLGDDIKSYVGSLYSNVESDVASFVDSGLLDFPTGFPTGTAVQKSLGVSDSDLDAQPTQVLNLP